MSSSKRTGRDPLRELNPKQRRALGTLVAGGTQQQAADAAGVTRQTVNEWVNRHPGFAAEYRQHLRALNDDLIATRARGNNAVIDRLLAGVESGDEFSLKMWLRYIGVIPLLANEIGPTDADGVLGAQVDELHDDLRQREQRAWIDQQIIQYMLIDVHELRDRIENQLLQRFRDLDRDPPNTDIDTDSAPDGPPETDSA